MTMLQGMLSTLAEIFRYLWARRLWWLVPMVLVLLLFGGLIILGSTAGVGPFIYTLF